LGPVHGRYTPPCDRGSLDSGGYAG
jgi:hypothetical protein